MIILSIEASELYLSSCRSGTRLRISFGVEVVDSINILDPDLLLAELSLTR